MINESTEKKAFASIDPIIGLVPEWFAIKLFETWVLQKSPKSVQRQFQLKYVDFFPFPGRVGRNLKNARAVVRDLNS